MIINNNKIIIDILILCCLKLNYNININFIKILVFYNIHIILMFNQVKFFIL